MKESTKVSEILEDIILLIYPLILLFGFYIIVTGYRNPGGGFQGGAVVAAVFMSRYLVYPKTFKGMQLLKQLDKMAMIFVLMFATLFVLTFLEGALSQFHVAYNIIMNIFIGIKVICGLSIVFFTFMEIEGGKEN